MDWSEIGTDRVSRYLRCPTEVGEKRDSSSARYILSLLGFWAIQGEAELIGRDVGNKNSGALRQFAIHLCYSNLFASLFRLRVGAAFYNYFVFFSGFSSFFTVITTKHSLFTLCL